MVTMTAYEMKASEHCRLVDCLNRVAWMRYGSDGRRVGESEGTRRSFVQSGAVAVLVLAIVVMSGLFVV